MIGAAQAARKIELLYFAALKDRAGMERETLLLDPEVRDVRGLARWLERHRPALADGVLSQVRFAVDEELVTLDRELHDGAVVALLPPMSGG
jgi:molybdopterin converting factor subunit 1